MAREKALLELFEDLKILYTDLSRLIIEYDNSVPWLGNKVQEVRVEGCWNMATDQKYLYVCQWGNFQRVGCYTLDTLQLVHEFRLENDSVAIDVSCNELYVSDRNVALKVFNISTRDIIRQWNPPTESCAIKLYGESLYYVGMNGKIYVFNLSGSLINQFGKSGSGNGEFSDPRGIDIDDKFVYIADYNNCRVQVFHLQNCTYSHQWGSRGNANGQFTLPYEVRLYEELCYVGDTYGIQVFTKDAQFLSRLGKTTFGSGESEFDHIRGIVMAGNRLYVSNFGNSRLVVLE